VTDRVRAGCPNVTDRDNFRVHAHPEQKKLSDKPDCDIYIVTQPVSRLHLQLLQVTILYFMLAASMAGSMVGSFIIWEKCKVKGMKETLKVCYKFIDIAYLLV